MEAQAPRKRDTASVKVEANGFMLVGQSGVEEGKGVNVRPNVRVKPAPTVGRQARAADNVPRTCGPGLVARRWGSA